MAMAYDLSGPQQMSYGCFHQRGKKQDPGGFRLHSKVTFYTLCLALAAPCKMLPETSLEPAAAWGRTGAVKAIWLCLGRGWAGETHLLPVRLVPERENEPQLWVGAIAARVVTCWNM